MIDHLLNPFLRIRMTMSKNPICTAVLMLAISAPTVAAPDLAIVPSDPREFAPITVTFELPHCSRIDEVKHEQGRIRIIVHGTVCWGTPPPGTVPHEVSIGRLPAGEYMVELVDSEPASVALTVRRSALEIDPLHVDAPFGDRLDLTGSWMDPARPGHGVFIEHSTDGVAFVVLNTYDSAGAATFRTMPLAADDRGGERFPLTGALMSVQMVDGQPVPTPIGSASLQPAEIGRLELTLVPDGGSSETMELQRIGF
jgi:hypothetical protein